MLTSVHERAVFPGLEELFTAAIDYLVNHSSNGIFDVTTAFPDPENVDFDVLYAILLTFWINFVISYCASGGHLGFSPVFHCGVFFAHPSRTSSA